MQSGSEECYPVWLGRLAHLLREAQSHWPPFCFHSQLCKNDTRAAYQKTRMPWNWDEYLKWKLGHFQQVYTSDSIRTITFKNGGHCVRALRCHQGRGMHGVFKSRHLCSCDILKKSRLLLSPIWQPYRSVWATVRVQQMWVIQVKRFKSFTCPLRVVSIFYVHSASTGIIYTQSS